MGKRKWLDHLRIVSHGDITEARAHIEGHKSGLAPCPLCASRARSVRRNRQRSAYHEAALSCGLQRVRGALGGVYYE